MDSTRTADVTQSQHGAHHTAAVGPAPGPPQTYSIMMSSGFEAKIDGVKYSKQNLAPVKWLLRFQLAIAGAITVLHIITTAMDDHFIHKRAQFDDTSRFTEFFNNSYMVDHAATGIWVGLLILLSAIVGLCGVKEQREALIITPLVLNVLSLIPIMALIATISVSINVISSCRRDGEKYDSYVYTGDNTTDTTTSSTTPVPTTPVPATPYPDIEFFGEILSSSSGKFFCKAAYFKAWQVLDVIILICSVLQFVITLTVLVYNSIAACGHYCCFTRPLHNAIPVLYYNGATVQQVPANMYQHPAYYPSVPAYPQTTIAEMAPPYSQRAVLPPINHPHTTQGEVTTAPTGTGDNRQGQPPTYSAEE